MIRTNSKRLFFRDPNYISENISVKGINYGIGMWGLHNFHIEYIIQFLNSVSYNKLK